MPQLGESVTEGTVAQWLKRPGDAVEKYEAFVEVSTDKVNAEVPAPVAGTIRTLLVAAGETVPTGAPIAVIDEVGAALAEPTATPVAAAAVAVEIPSANGTRTAAVPSAARLSPAVRRLSRELGVDPAHVRGSGSNGRVTADDIIAASTAPAAPAGVAAPAPAQPAAPGELLPLTPVRRLIAARMVESKHAAPHAWTMVEVDVTALWRRRERERDAFARTHGVKLTLLPYFLHATAAALRAFPLMNASFTEAGILLHRDVHIGIAVAAGDSLVVPVVRAADTLSVAGLALAAAQLVDRARNGTLGADDLAGGTFTVNNIGATGSVLSAPIIVPGQAGIVTMEAVVKRPVVVGDDAIAIRSMMNVCLSLDHRVVDGAVAGAFLSGLKQRLQSFDA